MATFFENLRESSNQRPFGQQPFTKSDPIAERRWKEANLAGFEKAIEDGKIKGTDKYYEKERSTVMDMDRLYADLSIKFQDYFYNKYYDPSKGDEEVPENKILEESTAFIQDQIENTPLKDIKFDNGESFYNNFRKYGYSKNLLPSADDGVTWLYRDGKTRQVPELRYEKVFPFRTEPFTIRGHLGDKRNSEKKPV